MSEIRETLNSALALWQDITGVDPTASTMSISNWRLRETFEELNEALELDPTQVTAALLLAHFVDSYFRERKVTELELLTNPAAVRDRLLKPAELVAILARPEVSEARADYVAGVTDAVEAYGASQREDVQQLLTQPHELAILRRDALRSIAKLRVDQFLSGQPEPAHIRPVYNRTVHQWWDINAMLAAAPHLPSGVSLNLIRHTNVFESYFCFTVRNGANLFVVTDVPDREHPLQAQMSRRPDRELSRRAGRNWFPYGLLDLEYDEEARRLYVTETKRRELATVATVALPLRPVAELEGAELVWLTMMFDLLIERFWRQGWQAPALSYTAEMLKANRMLASSQTANLPALPYEAVALAPLTREDISSANVTEAEVGEMAHQPNAWMEARYGAQVPPEVFNLLGGRDDVLLLTKSGGVDEVNAAKYHELTDWQRKDLRAGRMELEALSATSFGSRERLDADRKFPAGVNYARQISRLAYAEYKLRQKDVTAWYAERVRANLPTLLSWAGNTALWVDDGLRGSFSGYEGTVGPTYMGLRNFVEHYELGSDDYGYRFGGAQTPAGFYKGHYECAITAAKASYYVVYAPATAHELALLAGCEVSELPDVLQHWTALRPYTGNHILDRIDPMVWSATNPWLSLDLRVRIPLSKRGMAQVKKSLAVVPGLLNMRPDPRTAAEAAPDTETDDE